MSGTTEIFQNLFPQHNNNMNIFTFKKVTKLMREKYPLLQLDCNKWNYAQIYTEKNGPNNRLIKKEKNQTICLTNFKERPIETQLALASSPN